MNIDSYEIYPYVRVYANLIEDYHNFYDTLQDLIINSDKNISFVKSDWSNPTQKFGDYLFANEGLTFYEPFVIDSFIQNFIARNNIQEHIKEFQLFKKVQQIKKFTIEDYIKIYNVNLPEKTNFSYGVNIAKYDPDFIINEPKMSIETKQIYSMNKWNYSMLFHTDYTGSHDNKRKEQFLITSNTYFNDDYEGGSIIFYVEGDKFSYKPKAGETLVFPSGSPLFSPEGKKYLHSVETNYFKEKFLSRNYLMYTV